MKYALEYIRKRLKKARKEKQLSQRELSVNTGIMQSQISKFETGIVDLQVSTLLELARAVDLDLMLAPRGLVPIVESM